MPEKYHFLFAERPAAVKEKFLLTIVFSGEEGGDDDIVVIMSTNHKENFFAELPPKPRPKRGRRPTSPEAPVKLNSEAAERAMEKYLRGRRFLARSSQCLHYENGNLFSRNVAKKEPNMHRKGRLSRDLCRKKSCLVALFSAKTNGPKQTMKVGEFNLQEMLRRNLVKELLLGKKGL